MNPLGITPAHPHPEVTRQDRRYSVYQGHLPLLWFIVVLLFMSALYMAVSWVSDPLAYALAVPAHPGCMGVVGC